MDLSEDQDVRGVSTLEGDSGTVGGTEEQPAAIDDSPQEGSPRHQTTSHNLGGHDNEPHPGPLEQVDNRRWAEFVMAVGTLTAAVAAAVAAVIAALALSGQSEANSKQAEAIRDQLRQSQHQKEVEQRQAAARVSWWFMADEKGQPNVRIGNSGLKVTIQNASSVPISRVYLKADFFMVDVLDSDPEAKTSTIWLAATNLPPCTSTSLDPGAAFPSSGAAITNISPTDLYFVNGDGKWKVGPGGIPELTTEEFSKAEFIPTANLSQAIGCN